MKISVTQPPEAIVTLDEVKTFLRVSNDDADSVISSLIVAAQAEFDGPGGWVGRCFGQQRLQVLIDDRRVTIHIPYAENHSDLKVEYQREGAWFEVESDLFYEKNPDTVCLKDGACWPDSDALRITYGAGMSASDPRLQLVRTAIFFHVKIHFDDGDYSDRLRSVIDSLLSTLRVYACH